MIPTAIGAQVDESTVRHAIIVPSPAAPNLAKGFSLAKEKLAKGIPTKITILPGTYREAIVDIGWNEGKAANTLLVVEGRGRVVWSGADEIPLASWTKTKGLLTFPWNARWGNFAYSWSAKGLIAHRSEMAFWGETPLRPRIIDRFEVSGINQTPEEQGQVTYRFLDTRVASEILKPGEFGVSEKLGKIYIVPPNGNLKSIKAIEVSRRKNLLDLRGKSKVVLRNIEFVKTANSDRDFGADNAVRFSIAEQSKSSDILIDKCKFNWNAHTGLHIDGNRWTIRDSEFSYNGGSGIASGKSSDILFERNKTNFNVWRLWRAGELGYYTGGFKMHETTRHTIRGHEAIGNCTMGAWWDVFCRDVSVRDLVAVGNAANLQFELCPGPFEADRILLAGGKAGDGQLRLWEHGRTRLTNSILYSNSKSSGVTALYNLRWFGRTDVHAKLGEIIAGENVAENNIFLAGDQVPWYGLIDDIRIHPARTKAPMTYQGKGNIFWHPLDREFFKKWRRDEDRKDELGDRAIRVADWLKSPTYNEVEAKHFNPGFIDPDRYDFRIQPGSPLYGVRGQYLTFRLSENQRQDWARFTDFSEYLPEVWNTPPAE